jgi:hypothetical protein
MWLIHGLETNTDETLFGIVVFQLATALFGFSWFSKSNHVRFEKSSEVLPLDA